MGTVCQAGASQVTLCAPGLICDGTNLDAPAGFLPYLSISGRCTALLACPFGSQCALKDPALGQGILPGMPDNGTVFVVYLGGLQTTTTSCNGTLMYDASRVDLSLPAVLFWDVLYWLAPAACGNGSFLLGTQCSKCPPGTYSGNQLALSNKTCLPCPAGFISPDPGAATCVACAAGGFMPSPGGSTCQLCPEGSFQDARQSTGCKPCLAGTFAPMPGQTVCTQCPAGTSQASTGAVACSPCAANQFSSAGDPVCSQCGQAITPIPPGVDCPIQTLPDDTPGVWLSVKGLQGDECLAIGPTVVFERSLSVQVVTNSTFARCVTSMYVMGLVQPYQVWSNTVQSLQRPSSLRVYAYNTTIYPGLCRRRGFGVLFTVADQRGWPLTDLTGVVAQMTVLGSGQTLAMSLCERLPGASDVAGYGLCTSATFCATMNVTVRVSLTWAGSPGLSGSTDLVLGRANQPCRQTVGLMYMTMTLIDADGPYLAGDTMSIQIAAPAGLAKVKAFRFVLRMGSSVDFLAFTSTLSITQVWAGGVLSVIGTVWPADAGVTILGTVQTRLLNALSSPMPILCPVASTFFFTDLDTNLAVPAIPLALSVSCRSDGCVDALTDAGTIRQLVVGASRTMLINWQALFTNAPVTTASLSIVGIGPVVGQVGPVTGASCQPLSGHLLASSCTSVMPQGLDTGDANAGLRVTYQNASTVLRLAVFVPQPPTVVSYTGDTGSKGRYKLFTTLQAGTTRIANVDATPFVGPDAITAGLANEQWSCAPGFTGSFSLFGQVVGSCTAPLALASPQFTVLAGGRTGLGSIQFGSAYLSSGQTSGLVLAFIGKTVLTLDNVTSLSPRSVTVLGQTASMFVSGASGQCATLQLRARGAVVWRAGIPVYPPGPVRLAVSLGTSLLVSASDVSGLLPTNTSIRQVGLIVAKYDLGGIVPAPLGDLEYIDVTRDPRLTLSASLVQLAGLAVQALSVPGSGQIRLDVQGMPCVQTNVTVTVVPAAVVSSALLCTACPQLTSPDDPLSQEFPSLFPSSLALSHFSVLLTLADGTTRTTTEPLTVTGSATLSGTALFTTGFGQVNVSTPSTLSNPFQLNVLQRWAVSASLTCNDGPCAGLKLAPPGDPATLEPFFYTSTLTLGVVLGLVNGSTMQATDMNGLSLLANGKTLNGTVVQLRFGPLKLDYVFDPEWGLPGGTAWLDVARFGSLEILGPSVIYQIHCSNIWQEVAYTTQITLSDGTRVNVTAGLQALAPLVMHAPGLFHADWAGDGTILASYGTVTGSRTVTATLFSVFFSSVVLDGFPSVWHAPLGEAVQLSTTLSPSYVAQPWFDTGNLTDRVVQWTCTPPGVLVFGQDKATLSGDCYAPVTVLASLKACQGFKGANFSKNVAVNIVPTTPGQVDLGSASGKPLSEAKVGEVLAVDVAVWAPTSLKVSVFARFLLVFARFCLILPVLTEFSRGNRDLRRSFWGAGLLVHGLAALRVQSGPFWRPDRLSGGRGHAPERVCGQDRHGHHAGRGPSQRAGHRADHCHTGHGRVPEREKCRHASCGPVWFRC